MVLAAEGICVLLNLNFFVICTNFTKLPPPHPLRPLVLCGIAFGLGSSLFLCRLRGERFVCCGDQRLSA